MENIKELSENSNKIIQNIQDKCIKNIDKLNTIEINGNIIITKCIKEAHEVVDNVIRKSAIALQKIQEDIIPNITWLRIEEFTVGNGLEKIEEFIKTWERGNNWLYCVDFICEDICEYSKRYRYRVQWSIPTRRKPIPRATASVYFTLDVSNVMPKTHLVQVYYIFESSKLVHRPGASRFREKWLKDIVDAKVILMESVTF